MFNNSLILRMIKSCIPFYRSTFILCLFSFFCFTSQAQTDASKENVLALIDSSKVNVSDFSKSMKFARKALKLSLKLKSNKLIANSHVNLSNVDYAQSHYSNAIDHLNKAKLYYGKDDSYDSIAKVVKDIGRIYYESGDYTKASEYYFEVLNLCKKHQINNETKAWTLRYLGSVYKNQKKFPEARKNYNKAYELFNADDNYDGMASSLNNLGLTYIETNDSMALTYFERATTICSEYNINYRIIVILGNIGRIYKRRGDYDRALDYFVRELNSNKEYYSYDTYEIALCNSQIAEVEVLKGNYDRAAELLEKALLDGNEVDAKRNLLLENVYSIYSLLYQKTNNYQLGLFYDNLSDSLFLRNQNALMGAEVDKMKFKYDQQEINNKVNQDKFILEQNALNQRKWIKWLSIGFACLLILGLVIYFQKRRLRKAYQILVQRNLDIAQKQLLGLESTNAEKGSSEKDENRYSKSALTEQRKLMLLEDVIDLVESDKLYLDSNLTVQMLAESLGTNKSYVSQIINEKLNMNFSSFINEYRINEVIIAFRNEEFKNLTIEGIAKSIGFQSMSAFNSAFKKHTGITPSKFVKSLQNQR